MQKINVVVYSEKDIRKMVEKEVKDRFYSFERLLNGLKDRVVDIETIIETKNQFNRKNGK